MNNINNAMSAANILSTMSADTQALLESHFTTKAEAKIISELREAASGLVAKLTPVPVAVPKAKKAVKKNEKTIKAPKANGTTKREINTVKLPDGRSGSQYVRDLDKTTPGLKPKEVVERFIAEYPGLEIKESLVANVRSQAKAKEKKTAEKVVEIFDKAAE